MTSHATWKESANGANLVCGDLSAVLSGDHLTEIHWQRTAMPGRALSIETPAGNLSPPSETYIRGSDYVSTHEAVEDFPFRTQLLWSAECLEAGGVQVTLTVSLQTDLLDTNPELKFTTDLPAASQASAWQGEAVRFDGGDTPSVLVTPHPSDAIECEPQIEGTTGSVWLSPPFLEKGVIRRCRVAAVWLPGELDDAAIAATIEQFADTPLPLTT